MTTSTNPLFKHFRQPQIYIQLPSQGRWYPDGALERTETGEYPVYPMTAKDELTFKTPDALLNGQATVDVIQSCVPNIKNAWAMPSIDLDAVLIAIRQATYGNRLSLTSVCPHCNSKNEHDVDLGVLAGQITCPDYSATVKVDGLEIYLRPQNYRQFNRVGLENYEQQKLLSVVSDTALAEEERLAKFANMFTKLLDLTVEQVTKSVAAVKTDDGQIVEDRDMLDEFFKNCNKNIWTAVKDQLAKITEASPLKQIPLNCDECGKPYTAPLLFEMSSFFD